jgi:flavin-dependent dehydrogenase
MSTTMSTYTQPSIPLPPTLRSGTSYDVIVVGARAAGAATAMLLARGGLRTLLVDHSELGFDTLSTHALMRGGVLQLSRWGLLDEIIAAGTPAVRRTRFTYGDQQVVIGLKPAHGVDALYAPRRTLLDPTLVRAAAEAGAEVHHRTSVTGLIERNGRVTGVRATTSTGRTVEISAPLVIGADGIRSTVAREVGAPKTRVGEHAGAVTYAYWPDLETEGFEWMFNPNAASGIIPTNDGQACVFAHAPAERIGRGGVELIEQIVTRSFPEAGERLRTATQPKGTRTWRGHHGYIRQASGPGWALVGDAGDFKDPISAHGLTDALRDAELLARAVLDGFGQDATMDDALANYQAIRDRLSIPLFDIVDRIASHQWDQAEIADLLFQLSSTMADEIETIVALEPEPVS